MYILFHVEKNKVKLRIPIILLLEKVKHVL